MDNYAKQSGYANTSAQQQIYAGAQGQAVPREQTQLERALTQLESLSSRSAELCGNIRTIANKLAGEEPEAKADGPRVKEIRPNGLLGELFVKMDSIHDYLCEADGAIARLRRSV